MTLMLATTSACGPGQGTGTPRSTGTADSATLRQRLIAFVDDTVRATARGVEQGNEEPAREPDVCGAHDDGHHWTYGTWVTVAGRAAQEQFVARVKAHWDSGGYRITYADSTRVTTSFDGVGVTVRGTGPDGAAGMVVVGTTPCLPGEGTPVPPT